MIERSVLVEFALKTNLRISGKEDLLIMKIFAGRPRDYEDVKGILARQRGKLDWALIDTVLSGLLELIKAPERLNALHQWREEYDNE